MTTTRIERVGLRTALRLVARFAFILLLHAIGGLPISAQALGARVSIPTSAEGDVAQFWQIANGGIREDLTGTVGYLDVQNSSTKMLSGVLFYSEYLDKSGSLCLSLVLSRALRPDRTGPIEPGQIETFEAFTSGLFLACEPKEIKVYLLRQKVEGGGPKEDSTIIRSPIELRAGLEGKLQLPPNLMDEPFIDLLLGVASIGEKGEVIGVEVLRSASDTLKPWFEDFVARQAPYYPCIYRSVPKPCQIMIMIRAITTSSPDGPRSAFPPRMSPWVTTYVANLSGPVIPPIMSVLLTHVTETGDKLAAADHGLFQVGARVGDWSAAAFTWVQDPSFPTHQRRVLRTEGLP